MTTEAAGIIEIASAELRADVALKGGELRRLRDGEGRDLMWDGDPAFWTGRAPLLFPIIGRLKDDDLVVDGRHHVMKQHGFARGATFVPAEVEAGACRLELRPDAAMREAYPFAFTFAVTYRVEGPTLTVVVEVGNPGAATLPASVGFHPAFRWPLPYGGARSSHALTFARPEPQPLHRLRGGLLTDEPHPSPIQGDHLALEDALFVDDAMIFLAPASRSVRFGAPEGSHRLRVDFPDMPQLGIWTKPGAGFLCIEPWHGYASPEDFTGPFAEKPGLCHIPPGASHRFTLAVTLEATG